MAGKPRTASKPRSNAKPCREWPFESWADAVVFVLPGGPVTPAPIGFKPPKVEAR